MANIIRIRNLSGETNLNQAIVIPVDCDSYGINAKKISIYDLKSWILSGFTGGGNTSCTGLTSNIIRIIVTGTTTTTTTTTSTTTTTTTISPLVSRIYFNSGATGSLSVDNQLGRTFTIVFKYEIMSQCDNLPNGGFGGQTTTELRLSMNGGVSSSFINNSESFFETTLPYDTGTNYVSGITQVNNVYNISDIKFVGTISPVCSDFNSGSVAVQIISVTPNNGSASVICNDMWRKNCSTLGTFVNSVVCTTIPSTTTTTTTITPMVYYKLQHCSNPTQFSQTYCPMGTFNYGPPDKVQGSVEYYSIYGPPLSISFGLPIIAIENLSYVCTGGCSCLAV